MSEIAEMPDFNKLPEACISHVMSLTSPRDSCRSAAVSAAFRSAVDSDTVWDKFLPSDYQELLDRSVEIVRHASKRDLYFRLCDPLLIDGGKMSFQLDKSSGAKCYMISSRELAIVWGDTPHYWKWIPVADSRFPEAACLFNVCWLEIHGKVESKMLSQNTNYVAYLVFKLDHPSRGLSFPVQETSIKVGPRESKQNVCLQPEISENPRPGPGRGIFRRVFRGMGINVLREEMETMKDSRVPSTRNDGWLEIEMGEFFNGDGDDGEIDMCLMEVKGGHWKSGLTVLGIEVRPKK